MTLTGLILAGHRMPVTSTQLMTLVSITSLNPVDRAPAQCLGSHGFDPCQGIRFFSFSHARYQLITWTYWAWNSPLYSLFDTISRWWKVAYCYVWWSCVFRCKGWIFWETDFWWRLWSRGCKVIKEVVFFVWFHYYTLVSNCKGCIRNPRISK